MAKNYGRRNEGGRSEKKNEENFRQQNCDMKSTKFMKSIVHFILY